MAASGTGGAPIGVEATEPAVVGRAAETPQAGAAGRRSVVLGAMRAFWCGLVAAREPIGIFLLTRAALSFIAGYSYTAFVPLFEVPAPGYDRPALDRLQEILFGVWQHWDGQWYLKLATLGYNPYDGSFAFFPLYPAMIAWLSAAGRVPPLIAGLLISNLAYLVGLVYLYRLARAEFGPSVAGRTVLYLAVFPAALFFFAVYTESLFLALTVAAVYYARSGRWWLAGLLGLFAALNRSAGLLLVIPFALEYARQHEWNWRLIRPNALALALPAVGIALFLAYGWLMTGDLFASTHAQIQWERRFAPPWETLAMGWQVAMPGTDTPILPQLPGSPPRPGEFWGGFLESNGYNLAFTLLGLALSAAAFFKLPLPYSAYLLALVLFPMCSPSQQLPLFSMPRFLVTAFPLFFVLAMLGRRPWLHTTILCLSALLLGVFTARFAAWYWVA